MNMDIQATIPDGYYKTPKLFLDALKNKLKLTNDEMYYRLYYDKISGKFRMYTTSPTTTGPSNYFKFVSENLKSLTGIQQEIKGPGHTFGKIVADWTGGMGNLYLYCDIVTNSIIGDSLGPLICVLKHEIDPLAISIEYQPQFLIYNTLSKNNITEIDIEARSKTGHLVPFLTGELMVVLHIRARKF